MPELSDEVGEARALGFSGLLRRGEACLYLCKVNKKPTPKFSKNRETEESTLLCIDVNSVSRHEKYAGNC